MTRKTIIMHVPIEIYNKYGKEKLQQAILDFNALENAPKQPENKNVVVNPDLEVKQKESDVNGAGAVVISNTHAGTVWGDVGYRETDDRPIQEHKADAGAFTKEQTEFLQSQKFKDMMMQGIRNNFKPLYLDAVIITLKEQHNLIIDRDGLIEIMKDIAAQK